MGVRKGGVELNLDLAKSIFDWSWKLLAAAFVIAQFFFQFYMQQDRAQDRIKRDDSRIQKLETDLNQLQRELVQQRIEKGALQQQVQDQEKFYLLTTKH